MLVGLRARTIALVFSALVSAAAPQACHRSTKPQITLQAQETLLANLPREVRERIEQLLARGYNLCPDVPFEPGLSVQGPKIQELIYKTKVLESRGQTGQMNCLATIDWVLNGTETNYVLQVVPFMSRVMAAGYKMVRDTKLFKINNEGWATAMKVDLEREEFEPGDILIFARNSFEDPDFYSLPSLPKESIAHVALYVGQLDGMHYMFYKRNSFCGPDSRYEIQPVSTYVRGRLGFSTYGGDSSGSFTRVIVYR